jgi:hypothetical protein
LPGEVRKKGVKQSPYSYNWFSFCSQKM